ncbi:AAA family ATPase [Chloroflexus sp.]|uniref:AAA family ATPase n=1 Tax=Chloroflexus sp. TaxID=1904827 RepID=UPI002ACE0632|nr:AAA family ATPase [Chloroflexus sp.]
MSCDGNRGVFHSQVCGGGGNGPVAASFGAISEKELARRLSEAFGSPASSEAALEAIFDRARRQANTGDKLAQSMAEAQTRALFRIMQERGIKPPTHSTNGLPKADAQFGYAAIYQTLTALRDNKSLPAVAAKVQRDIAAKAGSANARTLSSIRQEVLGRHRCMSCGRFAPAQGGHLCPRTATGASMQRSLIRRLRVPPTAYPASDLDALIAQARSSGSVTMRHSLTGEPVNVTLDGLPLALTQGFVPDDWRGNESLALVEVSSNRIVSVLNDAGLNRVALPANAVEAAAVASGVALPPGTPVASAGGAPPAVAPAPVTEATAVAVSGGSAYTAGRFIGTEYRKARGAAKGETVQVEGVTFTVGEELTATAYWSSARITEAYPPPPKGITVGRTLPAAVELLRTGSVYEKNGKIEVYDKDGHLAGVYDPATGTTADVVGTPNASPAQMAALIAYKARHPKTVFDRTLAVDLLNMRDGTGTAIAAADGAYIAIHEGLKAGETLKMGGSLAAQKCPECGKFIGDSGCLACLRAGAAEAAAPAPTTGVGPVQVNVQVDSPVVAVEAPKVTVDGVAVTAQAQVDVAAPQITIERVEATAQVSVEAPQVTAQVDVAAPQVNLNLNADDLAAALNRAAAAAPTPVTAAGEALAPAPAPAQTPITDPVLAGLLARVVESQEAAEQRTMAILERLAGVMAGGLAQMAPAPSAEAAPTPAPAPKAPPRPVGRPVTPEGERTEQERLVAKVRRQAPDPTMSAVPAWARPANTGEVDLNELIPKVNPTYTMNEQARKITRTIATTLYMASKMGDDAAGNLAAFGLYGPPGSGKNELARQFAASVITVDADGVERQGLPYFEREIDPTTDPTDLIGGTAIENGRTVVRLGPVGQMLAMGGVVALNEVVRSPKLLTALQSAMEPPRTIRIPSPEGGVISIPVHPSSVLFTTWNPGMENDPDRPGGAPLARSMTFRLDRPAPEEQCARALAFFERSNDPEIQAIKPHPVEVRAAVDFFTMICTKLEQEGLGSGTVTPGARELNRFLLVGKTEGWGMALETLKIYCAQNSQDLPQQWSDFQAMFETCFGPDGQDVADRIAGAAPARSN